MDGGKVTWTDFRAPAETSTGHDTTDTAVLSRVGEDAREWNYLHYSTVQTPQRMRELLEKCCRKYGKKWDVNTPGPGGYTPLMLAVTVQCNDFCIPSKSSSSSTSSSDINDHNTYLSSLAKDDKQVPQLDTDSPTLMNRSASSFLLN